VTAATVFFVRHASHDRLAHVLCGRMAGVSLGEAGRAEAAGLAARLMGEGLAAAAAAARDGRDATTPMLARKGRASYLGERSVGHLDPGATSTALLLRAARTAFAPTAS